MRVALVGVIPLPILLNNQYTPATQSIPNATPNQRTSSGSPIFDRDGTVIAINSAILTTADGGQSFGGSNFGVPIRATHDLLVSYQK